MGNNRIRITAVGLVMCAAWAGTAEAGVTFVFTYFDVTTGTGVGFDDPAEGDARRAALETVAATIGGRIGQTATVEIGIAPSETDGTGPIGIGSATFLDTSPGIRDGEVFRRIVLGESDVDPGLDGGIVFDFGYTVALSGTPPAGIAYFPDVARHEMTHVLGYGSFLKADGTGFNGTAPDMYTRFDSILRTDAGGTSTGLLVVDSGGNLLLDAATYMAAHGTGLVFDAAETRAANAGAPHKLYAGDPTHSGTASDVMFPSPAVGMTRDDWSALDVAILKDLGYIIMDAADGTGGGGTTGGSTMESGTTDCGACGSFGVPFGVIISLGIVGMKRRRR